LNLHNLMNIKQIFLSGGIFECDLHTFFHDSVSTGSVNVQKPKSQAVNNE
jgi:hypothetical protein